MLLLQAVTTPTQTPIQYVLANVPVFGTAAAFVFGAGWTFGRFMFDRQIGALKQEVEILTLQLAGARTDQSKHQAELDAARKKVSTVTSEVRAGSRVLSSIPILLVIMLLGGALYSLKLILDGINDGFSKQVTANGAISSKIDAVQSALPKPVASGSQRAKPKPALRGKQDEQGKTER